MTLRKIHFTNLIGDDVPSPHEAWVDVNYDLRQDGDTATTWNIPVRYHLDIETGSLDRDGNDWVEFEDTAPLGIPNVLRIQTVFTNGQNRKIGGEDQTYSFPDGTGDVNFSQLVKVDPVPGATYAAYSAQSKQSSIDSAASAEAAEAAAASIQRNQPGGVAGLTTSGKLYEAQMPTRLSDASLSATTVQSISASQEVMAYQYGVSASNPDNTAALNAAFAAAKNKTVKLPIGQLKHSGQLLADACNIKGSGVSATTLELTTQLGDGVPALLWTNTTGQIRKLQDFEMKGPTDPALGVKTAHCDGLKLNNSVYLDQIKVQKFDAGIVLNSDSGHIYGVAVNVTNNYYGLYWAKNNSDFHFLDCGFTGNKFASIATPSNVGIAAAKFQRCHFGYGPIGVYQEPTPTNQGGNRIFLQEVTFDNSRFEQIGNAAILSDAQDDGSNFSQFADVTIINPGFSWADGVAGGSPWATLPTKKASFPIVVTTSIRNIEIIDGPNPFLPGLASPAVAQSDTAVGLFDVNRANHATWTRTYANGTGSQNDMRVRTSGSKNYYPGSFMPPADRVTGLALPRFTASRAGTAAGYIGRKDSGAPAAGTYTAGDWSIDATTPGIWVTPGGGTNPTDWTNIIAPVAASGVPMQTMASGKWYAPPGVRSTISRSNGALTLIPLRIDQAHTFTGLGVEVVTAGNSGALARLCVYADAGGVPGALITDAGTVAADSTGFKSITSLSIPLVSGWFWLGCIVQNAATTAPIFRTQSGQVPGAPAYPNSLAGGAGYSLTAGQSGAPASASTAGPTDTTIAVAILA